MRNEYRSPTAVDHHGTVVDDAVEVFEGIYSSQDINIGEAATEGFSYRYRAVGDGQVTTATSAVAARRWGHIDPERQYMLAWATGPGVVLDADRADPVVMQPNVPVMYPSGRTFAFDAAPAVQHFVRFDGTYLESVSASVRADLPGPLDLRTTADPTALAALRRTIAGAATSLWDPSASPVTRSVQGRRVAEAVLEAFDATPHSGLAAAGRGSVRVAQEWIAANAHRPLTTADVCRATGLSARGLQAAFHRAGAASPMQFLRDVRLHRVRTALEAGDPGTTTVAEVARAWGFAHLGRFAGTYASAFGERPSVTLQRRRSVQRPSSAPTASTTT